MCAAAGARGPVALEENAQAIEGEHVVDLGDVARVGGDHARQAAGGDHARLLAQLGEDALEDAVDEADVAVVEAALQMADGVGADDLGGALDVDAAEAGGAGEERVGAEAEAGSDGAAEVFAAFAEMTSNLVAVPKSTTMQGPPYFSKAAMESARRSAPSSVGLSTSTGMPVLMPGSTKSGSMWK